jgi:hypothetical protein
MSSLFIELEPNEKLYIESVEIIILEDLIKKIKNYISSIHIYLNDQYYFFNLNEEKNTNFKGIKLPKNTKIILENQNKISKFIIDANIIIKDVNMIEEKEYKNESSKEIINWNAREIKIINIPCENQSLLIKKLDNVKINHFSKFDDVLLKIIEECSYNSTTGNISFRFLFMDGREFLELFHYQMFVILKKFVEKVVIGHKNFNDNHYLIDIMVFVNDMNIKELGSAMIHKYVKNDEHELILPTKAIMRVNKKFLSKEKKDKINIKLIQTLFHELIHCLGFGYWELFGKEIGVSKNKNIIDNPKILSVYHSIFNNESFNRLPMTKDNSHYSSYNLPIIKNGKLWSILPALKYELMSDNDTDINVFSKLTASILEMIGYKINYFLCDEYPFTQMAKKLEIEYGKPTVNHFANGYEKYIILLKSENIKVSGIEIYAMRENTEYIILNNHHYEIYCVSNLDADEKYLLGKKEGFEYFSNEIRIIPNSLTPNLFFIVSSITFGGIPIVKINGNDNLNYSNCYNNNSLKKSIEEFINI